MGEPNDDEDHAITTMIMVMVMIKVDETYEWRTYCSWWVMLLITNECYEDNERTDSDKDDDVDSKWRCALVAHMVIIDKNQWISSIFDLFTLSSLMMATDDDDFVW